VVRSVLRREYYIGFGLILLTVAALLITFACTKVVDEIPEVVKHEEKSWSVNGTIYAGEKFFLYIIPPTKWHTGVAEAPTDYYPYGYIDVYVEIIDRYGNTTKFQFTWAKAENPLTKTLYVGAANVTVLQIENLIDPGAIEVGAVGGCGGVARVTGVYIARIYDIIPRIYLEQKYSPPPTLELVKAKVVEKYPNTYMLWFGVPLLCLGLYLPVHPFIHKGKGKHKKG